MIDEAWTLLAAGQSAASQTRVDAQHPHDIYADFEPPDRLGLVVFCSTRPPFVRPMRALSIEHGQRSDGRWALRIVLCEPQLKPVFAALCRDVIAFTKSGVDKAALPAAVVNRVLHWRNLLERGGGGLDETTLRGLIGELTVLQERVLPTLPPYDAVRCWTGPQGTPQDFQLPSGQKFEVKAIARNATEVRINGLAQLDAGDDPLSLLVVRLDPTGAEAVGATSAGALVAGLRSRLGGEPEALGALEASLASMGWHDHPAHDALAVRVVGIEEHEVGSAFPRLIRTMVPAGILDADYIMALPGRSIGIAKGTS